MPFTTLSVPDRMDFETARVLAQEIQTAFETTCNVPPDDQFYQIVRLPEEARILHPTFGGVVRSSEVIVAQVTLLSGRTDGQKKAFYAAVAQGFAKHGVRGDDIMIFLQENAAVDWTVGRGLVYAELTA